MTSLKSIIRVSIIITLPLVLHSQGPLLLGFMSDDYDLIAAAGGVSWFRPLESHHLAPLMNSLFKLTAANYLTAKHWHLLALVLHLGNCLLVYHIITAKWQLQANVALAGALIFAAGPAGYEAQAWAAALGYVVVTTWALLAFLLGLNFLASRGAHQSLLLGFIQLAALASWDWGVLVTPLVASLLLATPSKLPGKSRAARFLLPSLIVIVAISVYKLTLGAALGYNVKANLVRGLGYLGLSPLWVAAPNLPIELYTSWLGITVSAAMWLTGILLAYSRPQLRFPLIGFALCQVPYLLFGAPQSRYFYLASVFWVFSLTLSTTLFKKQPYVNLILLLYLMLTIVWANRRAELWYEAYQAAMDVKSSIESLPPCPQSELVIVNLPDSYGAPNIMWRPYIWRNGLRAIPRTIVRINTHGCLFIWAGSDIPLIERSAITARYPHGCIYEFIDAFQGKRQVFELAAVPAH